MSGCSYALCYCVPVSHSVSTAVVARAVRKSDSKIGRYKKPSCHVHGGRLADNLLSSESGLGLSRVRPRLDMSHSRHMYGGTPQYGPEHML